MNAIHGKSCANIAFNFIKIVTTSNIRYVKTAKLYRENKGDKIMQQT